MDRLRDYFTGRLDDMLFVELSEDFIEKAGAGTYLKDVPVPVHKDDIRGFASGGIRTAKLGERMVEVIGCDPEFRYCENYIAFLRHAFDDKLINVIMGKAAREAEKGDPKSACVQYRAALALEPENAGAMFGYARTCQDIYIESEDDEEIGRFKAESLSGFEEMTIKHPDIPEGHYYLGYAYVNMGLYLKAQIAWQEFIRLRMEQVRSGAGNQPDSSDQENDGNFRIPDDVTEIRSRLDQLEEPVKIEEGCNHIIAGRYDQGIEVLEKFVDGPHSNWWPMHYYLGTAYRETGRLGEAAQSFRAVLQLNASHIDSMQELVEIYGLLGETELEQKYRNKMMLVREMQ